MEAQQPDGSWSEKHSHSFGPLIDTPFALLFLKRANIAKDLTLKLRETIASWPGPGRPGARPCRVMRRKRG